MFVLSRARIKVDLMRFPKVQVVSYSAGDGGSENQGGSSSDRQALAVALATVEIRAVNEQEKL
jgi:hypothetical protein